MLLPSPRVVRPLSALLLGAIVLAVSARALSAQAPPADSLQRVYYDTLDDQGRLTGGMTELWLPEPHSIDDVLPAFSTTLTEVQEGLGSNNRVDLVFVGDGYTSSQLGTYATHVDAINATFFNKVPYSTYQNYFAVHRIDVVSAESGVDHDPVQGILKNTALDMEYWCNDIDRLLCVSVTKAYSYANNAPDVDLVAALANSTTYGGAGYPSNDLATCAAANDSALEIMRHEFGHALGNLADEYHYGEGNTYTGSEPSAINVSKLTAAQMATAGTKWASWLNTNLPAYDGLVSTFEGANYAEFGIYRPTNNSLMRSLDRPFNPPSIEKLIIEIYKKIDPIDAASSTSTVYTGSETLFVTPLVPVGHTLSVQWSLNGQAIAGANGTMLDLASLGLGSCPVTVSVTVRDDTTLVRNETARAQWMTQTLVFNVNGGGPLFENFCTTSPNSVGPGAVMAHAGSSNVAANNFVLIANGCPPNANGLFFYGQTETSVPFGNGVRCIANPFYRLPALTTDFAGQAAMALDLNALSGAAAIDAGETWKFQLWYRNPAGGGAGTNTSDGLSVRFCP